jgi:hypothetical protein
MSRVSSKLFRSSARVASWDATPSSLRSRLWSIASLWACRSYSFSATTHSHLLMVTMCALRSSSCLMLVLARASAAAYKSLVLASSC